MIERDARKAWAEDLERRAAKPSADELLPPSKPARLVDTSDLSEREPGGAGIILWLSSALAASVAGNLMQFWLYLQALKHLYP